MKESTKSLIKCLNGWDLKQFIIGFIFGIALSLMYNSAMYFSLMSASKEVSSLEYKALVDSLVSGKVTKERKSFIENKSEVLQLKPSTSATNICGYDRTGPRILCTIFTYKKNFNLKAQYVDKTWGKRCDKTIFMSGDYQSTKKAIQYFLDFV